MAVLTEEQSMLRDAARAWTQEKSPVTAFRKLRDSKNELGFDAAVWSEMGEMGWAGVVVPEAYGGSEFGYVGLGLVLEEAASDLGAPRWQVFWLVTFPLSLPGVGAGVLLCFIPIVGEFVIPDLLAGSNSLMIGQTLWLEFFTNKDWPVASAAAIALLVLLIPPLLLYDRLQRRTLAGAN
jgi:hypothetical protein